MKKFLKITGITLASLLGLLLLVTVIGVSVLCHTVFTPKKLTPLVQQVGDSILLTPHHIGTVNLTLFHTFPHFGLEVEGLYILNPQPGAQSDTLLAAPRVYVGIDVDRYLDDGELAVTSVELPDVVLNAYIDSIGHTNFELDELFRLSDDDTDDTTALSLPFSVTIDKIAMNTRTLTFLDRRDSLDLRNLSVSLSAAGTADEELQNISVEIKDLSLGWEELQIAMNGVVTMTQLDTIGMDLKLKSNVIGLATLRKRLPVPYQRLIPAELTMDGEAMLSASVHGAYADSTLFPQVEATLTLTDGEASYKSVPLRLQDINASVTAGIDLMNMQSSAVAVHNLSFRTGQTVLSAKGTVSDLMGDMLLDLAFNGKIRLSDFASFLPERYPVQATFSNVDLKTRIRLSDLTNMRLKRGTTHGELLVQNLSLDTDSLRFSVPEGKLVFDLPAKNNERKKTDFLSACLKVDKLDASMLPMGSVAMGETDIDLCVNDILSSSDLICADLDIRSSHLEGVYNMTDSTGKFTPATARLQRPDLCAYVEYDTKDTTGIPVMTAKIKMANLDAVMDTISLAVANPGIEASIRGGRRDKTQPSIAASLSLSEMKAVCGTLADLSTGSLTVKASARRTNNKENILLEWRPRLDCKVYNALARTSAIEDEVHVPVIDFTYNNREFLINSSRIEMGRSDFSLTGEVHNIGPWLEGKSLLTGQLYFNSSRADINALMSYVSGFGNDEEELNARVDSDEQAEGLLISKEGNPFIVPKGVDLSIETKIDVAEAFGQSVRNLGGHIYVRDGILIMEEVGFVCEAAKMQLTAMYKTPRRNHIFAGFDYHMTDINIASLIDMIPQVDSLLPMLRSFKGEANFHLAAETYLNSHYQLKPSTIRGASSLSAKDLTLLDGETFTKIAKLLTFKKSTENKIDSLSVELSLYKRQLTIYPFLISCDRWLAAVGGQHYLDMTFDYHVNVLRPLYLGVGVSGSFDNLDIKLEKCIYAKDFIPVRTKQLEVQSKDIRKMIRSALEANMERKTK